VIPSVIRSVIRSVTRGVRLRPLRPARLIVFLVALTGCPGPTTPTTRASVGQGTIASGSCVPASCDLTVHVGTIAFDVSCDPVAEALTDIDLPHHAGEPKIKALAGVARVQGVAVYLNAPEGCGLWALGLAEGLSASLAAAIRDEVRRGVRRFGVTATPIPKHGP
jgi:hypothetical protein